MLKKTYFFIILNSMKKEFGGKVTPLEIEKYSRSKHWDGQKFNNLEETKMDFPFKAIPKLLYKQLFKRKNRQPKEKIKAAPFNSPTFLTPSEHMKFIWYGHSALLMRVKNNTILIDPMFGPDAAPIAPDSPAAIVVGFTCAAAFAAASISPAAFAIA